MCSTQPLDIEGQYLGEESIGKHIETILCQIDRFSEVLSTDREYLDSIRSFLVRAQKSSTLGYPDGTGVGILCLLYGVCFFHLYLPDKPYDPARKVLLDDQMLMEKEKFSINREILSSCFEPGKKIPVYKRKFDFAVDDFTQRRTEQLPDLYKLLHDFEKLLRTRVQGVSRDSVIDQMEIKLLYHSSLNLIDKLESFLGDSRDILSPLLEAMEIIKLGCFSIFSEFSVPDTLATMNDVLCEGILQPNHLHLFDKFWQCAISYSEGTDLSVDAKWMPFLFGLLIFQRKALIVDQTKLQEVYVRLVNGLISKWQHFQIIRAQSAMTEQNLYRDREAEDELEVAMQLLFPSRLQDTSPPSLPESLLQSQDSIWKAFLKDILDAHIGHQPSNIDDNYGSLATLLFGARDIKSSLCLSLPQKVTLQLSSNLVITDLLRAREVQRYIGDGDRQILLSPHYDFYRNPNLEEAKDFDHFVQSLQTRLRGILKIWNENSTLRAAMDLCETISKLSSSTSLSDFLSFADELYKYLDDWQAFASKEYSVELQIDALRRTIVKWRKLELGSWQGLFDRECLLAISDSGEWWIRLLQILYQDKSEMESGEKNENWSFTIVTSLLGFLQDSTLGTFSQKVRLLKSCNEISNAPLTLTPAMTSIVSNILQYVMPFELEVKESVISKRGKLDKEMQGIIKLAGWREINIYALQESATKSQRQLTTVVNKFRDVLLQPVMDFTKKPCMVLSRAITDLPPFFKDVQNHYLNTAVERRLKIDQVNNLRKASYLVDVEVTIQKIKAVSQKHRLQFEVSRMEQLGVEIFSDAQSLRQRTPENPKDGDDEEFKRLLQLKKNVFRSALAEMKSFGYKHTLRHEFRGKLTDTATILAGLPSFHNTLNWHTSDHFDSNDVHLFELVVAHWRVKDSLVSHSPDLSREQVTKCYGYYINILSTLIEDRQQILSFGKSLKLLNERLLDVGIFAKDFAAITSDNTLNSYSAEQNLSINQSNNLSENSFNYLPPLLRLTSEGLRCLSEIEPSESAIVLATELSRMAEAAQITVGKYKENHIAAGFSTFFAAQWRDDFEILLSNICDICKSDLHIHHETITAGLLKYAKDCKEMLLINRRCDNEYFVQSLVKLDSQFESACKTALISLQIINNMHQKTAQSEASEQQISQNIFKTLASLNIMNLAEQIRDITETCNETSHQAKNLKDRTDFSALVLSYYAILQEYAICCCEICDHSIAYHRKTCRGFAHLVDCYLHLVSDGFCKPKDSAPDDGSTQTKEGTGLGDGIGDANISNEIENDEDLESLKDDHEEKEKKKDEEIQDPDDTVDDHEDAIERDELMENAKETDVNDADHDDNDSEQSEKSEIESIMDDEMRNKDMDVDDNMWNDDGKNGDTPEKAPEGHSQRNTSTDVQIAAGDPANDSISQNEDEEDQASENLGSLKSENISEELSDGHSLANADDMEEVEPLNIGDDNSNSIDFSGSEELEGDAEEENVGDMDVDFNEQEIENTDDFRDAVNDDGDVQMNHEEEALQNDENIDDKPDNFDDEKDGNHGGGDFSLNDEFANKEGASVNDNNDLTEEQANSDHQPVDERSKGGESNGGNDDMSGSTGKTSNKPASLDKNDGIDDTSEAVRQLSSVYDQWKQQSILESNEITTAVPIADDSAALQYAQENETSTDQAMGPATQEQADKFAEQLLLQESDLPPSLEIIDDPQPDIAHSNHNQSLPIETLSLADKLPTGDTNAHEQHTSGSDETKPEYQSKRLIPLREVQTLGWDAAKSIWLRHENNTSVLSAQLCEQLRLILEPTKATRLRGGFRNGKRLNMRQIIPYIASDFKKDKIWLKRVVPNKREYSVLIALDNSKSMSESHSVDLAFESLALILKAMNKLEVGHIGIARFGQQVTEVHPLDGPISVETGISIVQRFDFSDECTDLESLLRETPKLFESGRLQRSSAVDMFSQLQIIISDGICEDHSMLQRRVLKAHEQGIMTVFIIVDSVNAERKESIVNMNQVRYLDSGDGSVNLKITRYLDTFPFKYYVVVRDVNELPLILSSTLRQWFSAGDLPL